MQDVRSSPPRSIGELTRQWDQLAEVRDQQLAAGVDISFNRVVAPAALRLLDGADLSLLLDVGAGTGHFTALTADLSIEVIGIDPSDACLRIARRVCAHRPNVSFTQASIEEFAKMSRGLRATAAVAVMVMMTAPNLTTFAASLADVLAPGSRFVAVIPHPCFWATYWGYADADWFEYSQETFVEAPFWISNSHTEVRTTHIHRPLSQYLTVFRENGFRLDAVEEPMPEAAVQALYPTAWHFPRFMALRWIKG